MSNEISAVSTVGRVVKVLNLAIICTFGLGAILVIGGLGLAYFSASAETVMEVFDVKVTTTSIGVSMATLGVALVGYVVKKILSVLDTVAVES